VATCLEDENYKEEKNVDISLIQILSHCLSDEYYQFNDQYDTLRDNIVFF